MLMRVYIKYKIFKDKESPYIMLEATKLMTDLVITIYISLRISALTTTLVQKVMLKTW